MKKVLNSKFLFFIPLLIIMIISFLDMYNAKYLSTLYSNNLTKCKETLEFPFDIR